METKKTSKLSTKSTDNNLLIFNDGDEIFICHKKDLKNLIKEYFYPNSGRKLNNYDKTEYHHEVVLQIKQHPIRIDSNLDI